MSDVNTSQSSVSGSRNQSGVMLTQQEAATLRRIVRKVDSIRGVGVVNSPDSISIIATTGPNRRAVSGGATGLPPAGLQETVLKAVVDNTWGVGFIKTHK